jgi:hypothetical protein
MVHEAFQSQVESPFKGHGVLFFDMKGRCQPTNGEIAPAPLKRLQALGFPLANRLSGRLKPIVYNY